MKCQWPGAESGKSADEGAKSEDKTAQPGGQTGPELAVRGRFQGEEEASDFSIGMKASFDWSNKRKRRRNADEKGVPGFRVTSTTPGNRTMHVELKTNAVEGIEGLRNRIDRRLRFALGKFGDRIGRVVVFLSDSNGPKGGIDKSVRVLTRIDGVGLVVAMVVDSDWTVAVDRAAHRIGQNVSRALIRQRQRKAAGIRSSDATLSNSR